MQLYHRTLLEGNNHRLCLALHAYPIKPKEEHERPRQLLLASTNSLLLYRTLPAQGSKNELKLIHEEHLFSSICAMEAVIYQDDDLRKDIVIVTLANGKYQLLEWLPSKAQFAVIDQNFIFSDEQQVSSGLVKPAAGHLIAVNNEAKLVLIASYNYEARLYERTLGYQGIRLTPIAYLARPQTSICLQITPGQGSTLFYMLRKQLKQEQTAVKLFKLKKTQQEEFEEEATSFEDSGIHLMGVRSTEGGFFAVGEKFLYYTNKGKLSQLKIPQPKPSLQVCLWRRPQRERKDQFFMLNEQGEITVINFDDNNPLPCSVHYIEPAIPCFQVAAIDRNLFFLLSSTASEHLLIEATEKYKLEDRVEKTRSSLKMKEEKDREELSLGKGQLKEFQVVGSLQTGRVVRDMKISNLEKGMNNQILLTGGRPRSKKGFLSVIKYGLKLKSHLSVSCTSPVGIWAVKQHVSEKYHSHVVLAFSNRKTLTFHYDGSKLIPRSDLRLDENELTLHVVRFGDNSLVQVVPSKLKFINREGTHKDILIKGRIMRATSVNEGRQLLLSLVGGFIEYYEVQGGEMRKLKETNLEAQASHVEFAPAEINDHKPYSRLVAIGLTNYHVQIYGVNPKGIEFLIFKNIKVSIESMVFVPYLEENYCIYAGGHNGRSFKWLLSKAGEHISLEDEVVGQRTVRYSKISVNGKQAVFRLSPDASVSYQWQGQMQTCGLPLPTIEQVEDITLQSVGGSLFITYFENYLRFIEVYGFGNLLYTSDRDLEHPGKKIVMLEDRVGVLTQGNNEDKEGWVSRFLFLNPAKDYEIEKNIAFDPNERVLSVASVTSKEGRNLICFGCCLDHGNLPKPSGRFPSIRIYNFERSQLQITVQHLFNFSVDGPPTAMDIYFGKLLVGIQKKLILFDIFKQKLVLRATSDTLASPVCSLHVGGQKIFLTQVMESFSLFKINHKSKSFDLIGQDFLERFTTCSCLVDEEVGLMAGADKFGNIFLSKMSQRMKSEVEDIKQGLTEPQSVNGPNFMDGLVSYHLGEVVTAIQCGKVDLKKPERIFYSTIDGKIGMFYPMESEEEGELAMLRRLEEEMSKSSLAGASNHKLFRNQFSPAKGVIDGDFCELFQSLSEPEKLRLSGSLGKEPKQLMTLLQYMENKFS